MREAIGLGGLFGVAGGREEREREEVGLVVTMLVLAISLFSLLNC